MVFHIICHQLKEKEKMEKKENRLLFEKLKKNMKIFNIFLISDLVLLCKYCNK